MGRVYKDWEHTPERCKGAVGCPNTSCTSDILPATTIATNPSRLCPMLLVDQAKRGQKSTVMSPVQRRELPYGRSIATRNRSTDTRGYRSTTGQNRLKRKVFRAMPRIV
jgi:hypothetical protein